MYSGGVKLFQCLYKKESKAHIVLGEFFFKLLESAHSKINIYQHLYYIDTFSNIRYKKKDSKYWASSESMSPSHFPYNGDPLSHGEHHLLHSLVILHMLVELVQSLASDVILVIEQSTE